MQKRAARRGQRALAFLLCLLMVVTLLPVMGASAAGGGNAIGKDAPAEVSQNPVLDKFLTEDTYGNYTLTLTAYATGTTTTVTEKSGRPLDIVLVLDQSGSMSNSNYVQPLKNAVTKFVNSISDNAKEYNVDHRIALVGYASRYDSNTEWINTGLFINGSLYNYQKQGSSTKTSRLTAQNYKDALVSVNNFAGNITNSITTAISKINGNGATYTNYGMEMANGVFENNPIESGSERKRIVVVFTDGEPGKSGYDKSIANAALTEAYKTKNTYGATVYTVGLYSSANDNVTTFMNYLSSNYPRATSMDNNGVTPVTKYVPAAQINNSGTYYYLNNGNYERVYHCSGGLICDGGWFTQQHGFASHNGTQIDPNTTQFYVQQTTTPTVATKYYMTTSSSSELDKIFDEITHDIQHPSTDVTLNDNAELRDQISSIFDVKDDSTITVSTVAGTYNANGEPTWGTETQVSSQSFSGRNIGVTGFDYSSNYIAEGHNGKKLVVTITNLIPNDGFGDSKMLSNAPGAGIYESASATTPTAEFPSPWTKVPVYTKVLDFSMAANIATNVLQTNSNLNGTYGTFDLSSNNLTYKLGNRVADGNLVFDGVDSVLFYGDYNDDGNDTATRWNKVNVIPANNVYFDDDLLNSSSDFTDGDYGYDENVPSTTSTTPVQPENGENMAVRTFTFTGSRIDLYCTTADSTRTVTAAIYKASDYKSDPSSEPIRMMAMNNRYQSGTLYNVPTLSFDMKDRDTYTVVLYASTNANYQLDGIRVYNPGSADVDAMYEAGEQNATFLKVRDLLLNADDGKGSFGEIDGQSGVVYVDNTNKLGQTTEDIGTYRDVGPKNEVYLAKNSAIAFKVKDYQPGMKVMVGLSAPAEGQNIGQVTMSNGSEKAPTDVNSAVDMYYNVTPNADGYVVIENTGNVLISVTNVKLSGASAAEAAALSVDDGLLTYMASFNTLEVTESTPVDPEPTPEPPVENNTVSAIIHAIWAQVKTSIDRLFGRL